jgi:PilC-like protein with beta-propeller domain
MYDRDGSRHGQSGFAKRRRRAAAWWLAFLIASPALPDDRQLLQTNAGSETDVPDCSHSMDSIHDPNDPRLTCIVTNSGSATDPFPQGRFSGLTHRTVLQDAPQSILSFKRNESSFAAPSVPDFASGLADTVQIGAVIPSHENTDGTLSRWSIWSGSLKSYKLASNGTIPVVTPTGSAAPVPATANWAAGVPPTFASAGFPDESDPNDTDPANRRPIWNAARVLGFTDPVADLAPNAVPVGPFPPKAPAITVWPGRKMVWASGSNVPRVRQDLRCPGGACTNGLISAMGLNPAAVADQTRAKLTVDFVRGGMTTNGSRDEVLNQPGIAPPGAPVGPNAGQQQKYSYFYQDDAPAPGALPQFRTDGETDPKGYAHKLGGIFHSEPLMLDPPRYFPYLSADLNHYSAFARTHSKRRRVLFVGANDCCLHAFDAGVWDRDDGGTFDDTWDLGTGREIFAYAPLSLMPGGLPDLLSLPPRPQFFVDGSMGKADVFIDPVNNGVPAPAQRVWRSVLVGGLRQGGNSIWALDVTQPDKIDAQGVKTAAKDNAPDCLNGGGGGCGPTGIANRNYPEVLWELTDTAIPRMGQTWSRPTLGRVLVLDAGTPRDKYVAIFGGGFDPTYSAGSPLILADQVCPPTCPARKATAGRALYIVDVETGQILSKLTAGQNSNVGSVDFAPLPAPPAVVDFDDDGYLDLAYIGDVNGRMWRVDLSPSAAAGRGICNNCGTASQNVSGYQPFLLYDSATADGWTPSSQPLEPIFQDPAVIYVNGGLRPTLGIAFGTGDRADLARQSTSVQRFYYVVDSQQATTLYEGDLRNLTPTGGATPVGSGPGASDNGYFLDFATLNEKTLSSVLSTQGYLTLITFTPDSTSPCATEGNSFRYRIFFLSGKGGYNIGYQNGSYGDYRSEEGVGYTTESQVTLSKGTTTNIFLRDDRYMPTPEIVPGDLSTINQNWKEQQ